MRNTVTVSAVFLMLALPSLLECQNPPSDPLFSSDQLDNLLAPVALYPDPLLAQLLVAATYPDQITKAAKYIHAHSNPKGITINPGTSASNPWPIIPPSSICWQANPTGPHLSAKPMSRSQPTS